MKCQVVIENDRPAVLYNHQHLDGIDAIIPRIGASVTDYGCIIVRQFEIMKIFTTAKSQAISRTRNKLRSLQILSKAGVGLPKPVMANHPKDVQQLIELVGGPSVIIKLLEGTQGIGVVLAETAKAAKSTIEAAGKKYEYYSLPLSYQKLGDLSRLPYSLKVLLENLLRYEDDVSVSSEDVKAFAGWLAKLDDALADGRAFLGGDAPGYADCAAGMNVWFQAGFGLKEARLAPFAHVSAWIARCDAIGYGECIDVTAQQALDIARAATPTATAQIDADCGFEQGQPVAIRTEDPGADTVMGTLLRCTSRDIVLLRDDPQVGTVAVHFPRIGQILSAAS